MFHAAALRPAASPPRRRLALLLAVAATGVGLGLLAPAPASAQGISGVRGSDNILLARTYHRGSNNAVTPTGRFGVILGKTSEHRAVEVRGGETEGASYTLSFSVRRRGSGATIDWELTPHGGSLAAASGTRDVDPGGLNHLTLETAGSSEVFASFEVGRGQDSPYDKVEAHFAGMPSADAPAPVSPWVTPTRDSEPGPRGDGSGTSLPRASGASGASGGLAMAGAVGLSPDDAGAALVLRFRVEQDGRVVFAPVVRVRSGEAFEVRGGEAVQIGNGPAREGVILSGSARAQGAAVLLDLSVQSGRALSGVTPATYLVDRYRQGLEIPAGREMMMDLFGDLDGASEGRLRLSVTVARE